MFSLFFNSPAECNIDQASVTTYAASDAVVVSRVGVVATFRLGCSLDTPEPRLIAEIDRKPLSVSASSQRAGFKSVSFVEETAKFKSMSRGIEINIFDAEIYEKLVESRNSGAGESYYKPIQTIVVSHSGVSFGPYVKMETLATLGLIAAFFFAHTLRSKIVS